MCIEPHRLYERNNSSVRNIPYSDKMEGEDEEESPLHGSPRIRHQRRQDLIWNETPAIGLDGMD
jgi:hypothetical protein